MFGLLFKLNPSSAKCEENFPTALYRPWAQFWHPFPLEGNPRVMEEAGNCEPGSANKSSLPGGACGFSFLTQHPWGSDSSGWEFLLLCFLIRWQRPESRVLWLSTRLSSNPCLGVTLVRLIFVYGDQLGQSWWEGLPQNIDGVLIRCSREEGIWGFGLGGHLTLTQLVTHCPHRQKWPPEADLGLLLCCLQDVRTVWGAVWIAGGAGSFTPLGWGGKRDFKLFGSCGSLEAQWMSLSACEPSQTAASLCPQLSPNATKNSNITELNNLKIFS